MKILLNSLAIATLAVATLPVRAADGDAATEEKKMDLSKMTIVEVASGMNNFTTLVAAVTEAELAETLSGEGPFTVFAPTNDAFAKLPEGTVDDLLKPENREKLVSILTYHVVPGKMMAADVKAGEVKTVNGQKLTVSMADGDVMVNDAKVIKTNIVTVLLFGAYSPSTRFRRICSAPPEHQISRSRQDSEAPISISAVTKQTVPIPLMLSNTVTMEVTQRNRLAAPRSCIHRISFRRFQRFSICARSASSRSSVQSR